MGGIVWNGVFALHRAFIGVYHGAGLTSALRGVSTMLRKCVHHTELNDAKDQVQVSCPAK
jgi:hypothetical protein